MVSLAQSGKAGDTNGASLPYQSQKRFDMPSWEDFLGNSIDGSEFAPLQSSFSSQTETVEIVPKHDKKLKQISPGDFDKRQDFGRHFPVQKEWQV